MMPPRLTTAFAVFAALMTLLVVAVWARSLTAADLLAARWTTPRTAPSAATHRTDTLTLYSSAGGITLTWKRHTQPNPLARGADRPPDSLVWRSLPQPNKSVIGRRPPAPTPWARAGFPLRWDRTAAPPPGSIHAEAAIGCPLWFPLLILAPGPLMLTRHALNARITAARLDRGLCPACAYDLRSSPGPCPECGTDRATPTATETPRPSSRLFEPS